MTFYDFGIAQLTANGMFQNQAEAVMKAVVKNNKEMKGRWEDSIDDYPEGLKWTLWIAIQAEALNYIEKECPQAWFRPAFDPNHPLRVKIEAKRAGKVKLASV